MKWLTSVLVLVMAVARLSAQQEEVVSNDSMRPVDVSEIEYPLLAVQSQIEGVVVVKVNLDDEGKAVSAIAISGPTKLLVPASISNSLKWRFQPNTTKSAVIVYDFRLEGYCIASPCHSLFKFRPPNVVTVIAGRPLPHHAPPVWRNGGATD